MHKLQKRTHLLLYIFTLMVLGVLMLTNSYPVYAVASLEWARNISTRVASKNTGMQSGNYFYSKTNDNIRDFTILSVDNVDQITFGSNNTVSSRRNTNTVISRNINAFKAYSTKMCIADNPSTEYVLCRVSKNIHDAEVSYPIIGDYEDALD
jgi:hypothetical protein